jgi:hypothetical protein
VTKQNDGDRDENENAQHQQPNNTKSVLVLETKNSSHSSIFPFSLSDCLFFYDIDFLIKNFYGNPRCWS